MIKFSLLHRKIHDIENWTFSAPITESNQYVFIHFLNTYLQKVLNAAYKYRNQSESYDPDIDMNQSELNRMDTIIHGKIIDEGLKHPENIISHTLSWATEENDIINYINNVSENKIVIFKNNDSFNLSKLVTQAYNNMDQTSSYHILNRFRQGISMEFLHEKYQHKLFIFSKDFCIDLERNILFISYDGNNINYKNIYNNSGSEFLTENLSELLHINDAEQAYYFDLASLNINNLYNELESIIKEIGKEFHYNAIHNFSSKALITTSHLNQLRRDNDLAVSCSKQELMKAVLKYDEVNNSIFALSNETEENKDSPIAIKAIKCLERAIKKGDILAYEIDEISTIKRNDPLYSSYVNNYKDDGGVRIKIKTGWNRMTFLDLRALERQIESILRDVYGSSNNNEQKSQRRELVQKIIEGSEPISFYTSPYMLIIYINADRIQHYLYKNSYVPSGIDNCHQHYGSGDSLANNDYWQDGNRGCTGSFEPIFAESSANLEVARYISTAIQYCKSLTVGDIAGNNTIGNCIIANDNTKQILSCPSQRSLVGKKMIYEELDNNENKLKLFDDFIKESNNDENINEDIEIENDEYIEVNNENM